ncbi:MAG: type III toxin-antitoxin system ToxN/AbiQ family toxin, partial [Erysipelotrichaceae bacterium]|nr:type III toxin-antitoxin system ToxN/AbiQ family toxin [Erysipelotrichaceae bacterium]
DETIAIRLSLSGKPNNYINLVDMEEKYCSIHASEIQSRSLDVYNKVIAGVPMYRKVCCDFRKLEVACDDWVKTHDVVSLNK